MITPLRKRTLAGELYSRDSSVEALLVELSALSPDELITRVAISRRADPRYVRSECLLYFVRASRYDATEAWFERLYRILAERVLRSLPRADCADGQGESFTRGAVRDKVLGRFAELLSADRKVYQEKLDYFEVRFDGALEKMRLDAQRQAWRDEKRSTPLESDEESGELSAEVERAAGQFEPFMDAEHSDPIYRSRLDAAIDTLPTAQSRVIHMLREGFPIDSKEPDAMTIAKALGRSEKTIRNYRDRAFATLRAALHDGADK